MPLLKRTSESKGAKDSSESGLSGSILAVNEGEARERQPTAIGFAEFAEAADLD